MLVAMNSAHARSQPQFFLGGEVFFEEGAARTSLEGSWFLRYKACRRMLAVNNYGVEFFGDQAWANWAAAPIDQN